MDHILPNDILCLIANTLDFNALINFALVSKNSRHASFSRLFCFATVDMEQFEGNGLPLVLEGVQHRQLIQ